MSFYRPKDFDISTLLNVYSSHSYPILPFKWLTCIWNDNVKFCCSILSNRPPFYCLALQGLYFAPVLCTVLKHIFTCKAYWLHSLLAPVTLNAEGNTLSQLFIRVLHRRIHVHYYRKGFRSIWKWWVVFIDFLPLTSWVVVTDGCCHSFPFCFHALKLPPPWNLLCSFCGTFFPQENVLYTVWQIDVDFAVGNCGLWASLRSCGQLSDRKGCKHPSKV